MLKIETIRDGQWDRLSISESEVEDRKIKYFAKLDSCYPNLESITPEEYKSLVAEYNNGNQDIIDELIKKTSIYIFRPIVSVFSRYAIKGLEFEDALNESILTYSNLILENNFYFPKTKSEFIIYINRKMVHLLKREDQRIKRRNVQLCLDCEHIDYHQAKEELQFDLIDDKLFKEDVVKVVAKIYNKLDDLEKQIFNKLFKESKQEFITAKELSTTREKVNQTKRKVRKLILRKLAYELKYIPNEYEFGGIDPYEN